MSTFMGLRVLSRQDGQVIWTISIFKKDFTGHFTDFPGCVTRICEFQFPCNGTERSISDSKTFSMFPDLMFLSKEFVSTAQTSLGTPATVIVFGCEFALILVRRDTR